MKKETGITLLVLVVTIIVLLILAGIAISSIVGNNGVVGKAKQASVAAIKAEVEEKVAQWRVTREAEKSSGKRPSKTLPKLLKELQNDGLITDEERKQIMQTGEVTIGDETIVVIKESELEENSVPQILEDEIAYWKEDKQSHNKTLVQLLDELESDELITADEREEIEQTGEVTIGDKTIVVVEESEFEENGIIPKYVAKVTTKDDVTTKYETIEDAVAALQDGDLLKTIGTLNYDKAIAINKNVTVSGKFNFTTADARLSISDKTLTLKDLTITGISSIAVCGTNRNSKIYVGENSNVSITSDTGFAVGIDAGEIEIHSGTYKADRPIYCGGSQYGGHFVTTISGSDTHLIGAEYIFRAFSSAQLTVGDEVDIQRPDNGGEIIYKGGAAVFNIPENFVIYNEAHGSYTKNGVFYPAY